MPQTKTRSLHPRLDKIGVKGSKHKKKKRRGHELDESGCPICCEPVNVENKGGNDVVMLRCCDQGVHTGIAFIFWQSQFSVSLPFASLSVC